MNYRLLYLTDIWWKETHLFFAVGMAEKAKEFVAAGGEIYHSNLPDGVKDHH